MIKAVAFDMDDTLYDEIDYCVSAFHAVADFVAASSRKKTSDQLYDAFWSQFNAGNRERTFNAALDLFGIPYDDRFIKAMIKTYREHFPSIKLPEETLAVLEALQKQYMLALLTDGFLPAQELKAQALGIEKYFQCIVYTERLGRQYWKPSPAGFEFLADRLGVEPCECVYVADNDTKDFIAPNALGFETVQVLRPNRVHREQTPDQNARARYVIDSLGRLPELLKSF